VIECPNALDNGMGDPLVSVIITTYNRPSLLLEAVASVLNQTYKKIEVVVVDNHSLEDVGAILENLKDERIRFFKNANGGIIAVNRNVGIRQSRGQMLAFCDDDDLWTPNKLERQLAVFRADRHIGIGSSERIFTGGSAYRTRTLAGVDRGLEDLLKGGPVPFSSLMVAQTGTMFSEDPHLRTVEDFDFQLRLVHQFKKAIAVVEEPLIYFRIHTSNNNRNRADRLNGLRVLRSFREMISSDIYRKALSRLFFLAGILSLKSGERDARRFFQKAIIFRPDNVKARALLCLSTVPVSFCVWIIRIYYFVRTTSSLVKRRPS
jgi:glycosyltransferase involved in cell wall biosynthesis